jgi:hypothetical protein
MRPWIERELSIDGVLAAGGGNFAGTVFPALAQSDFGSAAGQDVWSCLAETLSGLLNHGGATGEMLWGFDAGVLCTVRRNDGLWMGVFTSPHLGDEAALALRAKLDAFKVMEFGRA